MSDAENEMAVEDAPVPEVPTETIDQTTALKLVLKKALAHDGLARGLREVTRAIEREQGQLCVLADDCNQADYKKLVKHLCMEKKVDLVEIDTNKTLGQLAGLYRLDDEGEPRRVVGCSAALVTDFGEETEALKVLRASIAANKNA